MSVVVVTTADLGISCGYAKIIDESVYGAPPDSRADYGIVIMVQKNGVTDYTLSDFTNSNEWYVPIVNNTLYTVMCFQLPAWVAGSYAAGQVVYDYNTQLFWYNNAIIATTDTPGTGNDWKQLTNDLAGYNFLNNSCTGASTTQIQQACPNYTLTKVNCANDDCCREWQICDNSGDTTIKYLAIFDSGGNLITGGLYGIDPSISTCVTVTLPKQGVFIVGAMEVSNPNLHIAVELITSYSDFFMIYEFCQLQKCVQYLIDKILCSKDTCQEICDPCDKDKILESQKSRMDLNRIIALFGTLLAMENAEKITYLGVFDFDATRADFISKIGMYIQKIIDISIRCGICTGIETSSFDNIIFKNDNSSRHNHCSECH